MTRLLSFGLLIGMLSGSAYAQDAPRPTETVKLLVPYLGVEPVIDGVLDEWKDYAFNDGVWDINRIRHTFWYDEGRRNRLTDHGNEGHPDDDLSARYYVAWDESYLYFGAIVKDNVNDVEAPGGEAKAWYMRDSVCYFMEAPRDEAPEFFGQGDNAFCFTADATRPSHAAWWRHGSADTTFIGSLYQLKRLTTLLVLRMRTLSLRHVSPWPPRLVLAIRDGRHPRSAICMGWRLSTAIRMGGLMVDTL